MCIEFEMLVTVSRPWLKACVDVQVAFAATHASPSRRMRIAQPLQAHKYQQQQAAARDEPGSQLMW
jgi:hypothetical protein